jgi:endogenous inhibitor of DNA gyrase (YacG/DUF329 family)
VTELQLVLGFACPACGRPVSVTLRCQGKGPIEPATVACVPVPCPTCDALGHVSFETTGRLLGVASDPPAGLPRPSPN